MSKFCFFIKGKLKKINKIILGKTAETIHDQLNLIVQECVWYENAPCLIVLENLDLLIENKSHSIDPSSMLYHAQIVECKYLAY
jgi:hypothetical protein